MPQKGISGTGRTDWTATMKPVIATPSAGSWRIHHAFNEGGGTVVDGETGADSASQTAPEYKVK